jgi:hypothetical protein
MPPFDRDALAVKMALCDAHQSGRPFSSFLPSCLNMYCFKHDCTDL